MRETRSATLYAPLLGCGEVLFFYTPRASVCSLRDGFNRSSKKYSVPTTGVVEERNPLPANALEGEGRGGRRDTPSPVAARCSVRDAARAAELARERRKLTELSDHSSNAPILVHTRLIIQ